MSVALPSNYLAKLQLGNNTPNVVLKIELDSGTVYWGLHEGNFTDIEVQEIVDNPSALQHKLDIKQGYATKGSTSFTIKGRDNFKSLVSSEYLKNRRVTRYEGFESDTLLTDYVLSFQGTIQNWTRKGDDLTVTVKDDQEKTKLKIPVQNTTKTQNIDYLNTNPVDIMLSILKTDVGIDASLVDTTVFESERDLWLNAWTFSRVLTEPIVAGKLLNELQDQTNSYIVNDGQKISYKVIAPPTPNSTIITMTDEDDHINSSLSCDSGYDDFFNNVVVLYDYDESGTEGTEHYETAVISADGDSISSAEWDEAKTKYITSKWLRTYTHQQPTNVTGVVIYHTSVANSDGTGTLTYNDTNNTLTWQAPSGTAGDTVTLDSDGKYQIFDQNLNKSIRVVVTTASLPSSNQSDTIQTTAVNGGIYASALGVKRLQRYSNPATTVKFTVSLNRINNEGNLLKVSDVFHMTTDEAFDRGQNTWALESMFITSIKPDFTESTIDVEAIQTRSGHQAGLKYGYIAPSGQPDYPSASPTERDYAYIGRTSDNKVNVGTEEGFSII